MTEKTEHHAFTKNFKTHRWDSGPWCDEPDRVDFMRHGLPCMVVRHARLGHLCGYVGVDALHPLHGRDAVDVEMEENEISVHGGLSYSDVCEPADDDNTERPKELLICHKAKPGDDDNVWWLGFDACHSGDYVPGHMARSIREMAVPRLDGIYRTVDYMMAECDDLASQLVQYQSDGKE